MFRRLAAGAVMAAAIAAAGAAPAFAAPTGAAEITHQADAGPVTLPMLQAAFDAGIPIYEDLGPVAVHDPSAPHAPGYFLEKFQRVTDRYDLASPAAKYITLGAVPPAQFGQYGGAAAGAMIQTVTSPSNRLAGQFWRSPAVPVAGGPAAGIALFQP